jgi:hypothetical protein
MRKKIRAISDPAFAFSIGQNAYLRGKKPRSWVPWPSLEKTSSRGGLSQLYQMLRVNASSKQSPGGKVKFAYIRGWYLGSYSPKKGAVSFDELGQRGLIYLKEGAYSIRFKQKVNFGEFRVSNY